MTKNYSGCFVIVVQKHAVGVIFCSASRLIDKDSLTNVILF